MKHSELKCNYIQYFGDDDDDATVFSVISIAQYHALKLDYALDSATYKFIRDEKE